MALREACHDIYTENRVRIHIGEVERREDGRLGGIGLHIGARMMACASLGEVLVSSTVRGILISSSYDFTDLGSHNLKGVPGYWQVYAVALP